MGPRLQGARVSSRQWPHFSCWQHYDITLPWEPQQTVQRFRPTSLLP